MAKYVSSTQRSVTLEDVSNVRILPRLQEARGSWYDFDASAHADSSVVTCASMRAGQTTPSDHGFTGPFSCRCCCRHGIDHADLCGRLSESCREANAPCAVEQEIFRWCCSLGVARALADLIGKWEPRKVCRMAPCLGSLARYLTYKALVNIIARLRCMQER